ncbi:MAG TPA: FHA domain-containing protein [Verrucomicrobiota bacterium]|nr:FHA domain-containing protein [Verrucomicrobiota bacterium]
MAKLVVTCDGLPSGVIELKSGINRLGRSSENDFLIEHHTVSRFHCEIDVREDSMFVRDLDSSNGTFVNDQPVGRAQLESGHVLRLGDVQMEVKDAPKPHDPDSAEPCANNPKHPASMECSKCGKKFCGNCVHLLKMTTGQYLRLCPMCSGHCHPIQQAASTPREVIGNIVNKFNIFRRKKSADKPFRED